MIEFIDTYFYEIVAFIIAGVCALAGIYGLMMSESHVIDEHSNVEEWTER